MNKANSSQSGIGPFAALATVMGTVIGGGVFFKTASVVSNTHSFTLTILAWIVAGLVTIFGGLTISELGAALPVNGGPVKYLEYHYGKMTGYLMGWAQMLMYYPASMAALALVFATQFTSLFHISNGYQKPIAIICAFTVMVINLMGSKFSGRVQSLMLVIKLIPILIIAVIGLFIPGHVTIQILPMSPINGDNPWIAFGGGLLATMFAYDGWIGISNMAGEINNPKKNLPKAIILGLSGVTLIYTLINFVFLKMMPIGQIAGNQNTAFISATSMFGDMGGKLVTVGILVSVYGAINGYTLTGMQIPYVLGKEKLIPFSNVFSKLSKKNHTPYSSAIFQFVVAFIMMFIGDFDKLTDMMVFVTWIFFVMMFFEVFALRKKEPDLERPYKVPGFPIIPILAIVGGLFILISTLITQTGLAITGIILTLIGIPVYLLNQKFGQ